MEEEETKESPRHEEPHVLPVFSDNMPDIGWFDDHMKNVFSMESFRSFYKEV